MLKGLFNSLLDDSVSNVFLLVSSIEATTLESSKKADTSFGGSRKFCFPSFATWEILSFFCPSRVFLAIFMVPALLREYDLLISTDRSTLLVILLLSRLISLFCLSAASGSFCVLLSNSFGFLVSFFTFSCGFSIFSRLS